MKFLAGLIVAIMTASLFSLTTAAPAQAAPCYSASIETRLNAYAKVNPIRARHRARYVVRIIAENGRQPNANLHITIRRQYGRGRVISDTRRRYFGGREKYYTARLPRGRFIITVEANIRPNRRGCDRYQNSQGSFGQRVVARRRR